jgi:small-conductance mechanosensitive channel
MIYRWIVFLHVLGAFGFFMAHGASAVMAFRLQKERNIERIKAIMDLSNAALPAMYYSLALLLIAGIAAGFKGHWFSRGWIWAAIVILVVIYIGMHAYAFRFFTPIRKAVGLPYKDGRTEHEGEPPLSEAEIETLIKAANPIPLFAISFGLLAVILWLMMFKPF